MQIDESYFRQHPNHIYVFSDDIHHESTGGVADLRHLFNIHPFITKKSADNTMCFRVDEYSPVFYREVAKLKQRMVDNPLHKFLISQLGSGNENRFHIYENVIEPNLKRLLSNHTNIEYLWDTTTKSNKEQLWWGYMDKKGMPKIFPYIPILTNSDDSYDPAMEVAKKDETILHVFGPFSATDLDRGVEKLREHYKVFGTMLTESHGLERRHILKK